MIKPSLSAIGSRIGRITDAHGHSEVTEPWRRWYKTARWQRLKQRVHLRDAYTCQRTGLICSGRGSDWNAPVAHHIVPHRGDPVLFWDENNIQTVSKREHDGPIAAEEARLRAQGLL